MSSSSVGGKDWLDVDPGVGASFGWKDGIEVSSALDSHPLCRARLTHSCAPQQVEISIVHSLSPAKSISVAPLTPEDWEIIVSSAASTVDLSRSRPSPS